MASANRWLVLAIVSSALLLIVVDMTVLYTALPRLTHDLSASASEKLWILNAYPLVVAGLLPGFGTLGDRYGHRRMFLIGLVVFGFASTLAAFAPSAMVLIAARALLAVGAAAMMPATLSLIRLTFEDDGERALAIGIWAAVASGGAAFGPVIGGLLLGWFWWGSVFLVNVPIVILALIATLRVIAPSRGQPGTPWDILSSAQIMIGLIALAYFVKEIAKRETAWSHALIALVIGSVAITLFIRRQLYLPHPLIDLSLFRIPPFSAGVIGASSAATALIGVELVLSQRLQLVLAHSPLQAGLLILPIPLAAFVAGPVAGTLLPRIGGVRMLLGALAVSALGLLLYLPVQNADVVTQSLTLAVFGLGIGAAMTAASSIIMMSAPRERAGMAAAVEEVSYELGGALGIAILGSVMSLAYTYALPANIANDPIVYDSLDEAIMVAEQMPAEAAAQLIATARGAFEQSYLWVSVSAAAILIAATLVIRRLQAR